MPTGWAICTLDGRLVDGDAGYREIVGFSDDAELGGFDFVAAGVISRRQLADLAQQLAGGGFSRSAYPYMRLDGTTALAEIDVEPVDLDDQPAYAAKIRTIAIEPRRATIRDVVRRECFAALRSVLQRSPV